MVFSRDATKAGSCRREPADLVDKPHPSRKAAAANLARAAVFAAVPSMWATTMLSRDPRKRGTIAKLRVIGKWIDDDFAPTWPLAFFEIANAVAD